MKASGTFEVVAFDPAPVAPVPEVTTALPVGVATMEKRYAGEVEGRSATLFTSSRRVARASWPASRAPAP